MINIGATHLRLRSRNFSCGRLGKSSALICRAGMTGNFGSESADG